MEQILFIAGGLIVGLLIGFYFGKEGLKKLNKERQDELDRKAEQILTSAKSNAENVVNTAKEKAEKIIEKAKTDGENIKRKRKGEAKQYFTKRKADFEEKLNKRKQAMKNLEAKVHAKNGDVKKAEEDLQQKTAENDKIRKTLEEQLQLVEEQLASIEETKVKYQRSLEKTAKLTTQEAKEELIKSVKDEADAESISYVKERLAEAKMTANKEAKKIVIQSIQRMAAEYTIENTVSVFNLSSDDLKGQIIGREGRNIRALEAATGVEIIVDDTPEAVIISSFDPVRREVCRLSLQRLVADGRIHPARIEEVVNKTRKELEEQIMEIGQRTVLELNIHGLHNQLIRMVGRMRFRSSYGQNLLKHSIETAKICALMAAELGLSQREIKLAKRAGLLHDIGKVSEDETDLSHALLGMKLCERFGEKTAVCNAVGAHHDEVEMKYIISPIVQACDAISGARPGARREILESYLQRIKDLENLALAHDGVRKVYAMQAGRELRVIVESDKVSDARAEDLSFLISKQIQDEMQYPGQIKVTVIREKRSVAFAR